MDITDLVAERIRKMHAGEFVLKPVHFVNCHAIGYDNFGLFVQDVTSSVDTTFTHISEADRSAYANSKLRLLIGATITNEIRQAVKDETGYECSAGIAHNKIIAKLIAGMNKPNKQSVITIEGVTKLFETLPVKSIKSLGQDLGKEVCAKLNITTMSGILQYEESKLCELFGTNKGSWLYHMARGIDLERVEAKFEPKSIACSKNFRGRDELSTTTTLMNWLTVLSRGVLERLVEDENEYNRHAKHLIVGFKLANKSFSSRTVKLNGNSFNSYTDEQMAKACFEVIKANVPKFIQMEGTVILTQKIIYLAVTAGKFEDNVVTSSNGQIQNLLKNHKQVVKKSPSATITSASVASSPSTSIADLQKYEISMPQKLMKTAPKTEKSIDDIFAGLENETDDDVPVFRENTDEIKKESSLKLEAENSSEILIENIDMSEEDFCPALENTAQNHHDVSSVKYHIAFLLNKLFEKIKMDSIKNCRAPKEIIAEFSYQDKNNEMHKIRKAFALDKFLQKIDTTLFADKIFMETPELNQNLKQINGVIMLAGKLIKGQDWSYTITTGSDENGLLQNIAATNIKFPLSPSRETKDETDSEKQRKCLDSASPSVRHLKTWFADFLIKLFDEVNAEFVKTNRATNEVIVVITHHNDGTEQKLKKKILLNGCEKEINAIQLADRIYNEIPELEKIWKSIDKIMIWSGKLFENLEWNYTSNRLQSGAIRELGEETKDLVKQTHSFHSNSEATTSINVPMKVYQEPVKEEQPSAGPSYIETYAEFNGCVEIDKLLEMEECLECHKMIPKLKMIEHMDGHFAMQLSTQQRIEYRNDRKPKSLNTSIKSKPKSSRSQGIQQINSIMKYAIKDEKPISENTNNMVKCAHCSASVKPENLIEHSDYHAAQKLREEQMKEALHKKPVTPPTLKHPSKSKSRKRPGDDLSRTPKIKAFLMTSTRH